jgi:hypothetical protein
MKADLDLYVANSGPYRLAFVSAQIASALPSPSFDLGGGERPGVLGAHDGMSVIHPGWLWGQTPAQTQPRYLLVTRSGRHALAVDSYRLQRHTVEPPPAILAGQGMVFGIVQTAEGVMPVLDLARLPLA